MTADALDGGGTCRDAGISHHAECEIGVGHSKTAFGQCCPSLSGLSGWDFSLGRFVCCLQYALDCL